MSRMKWYVFMTERVAKWAIENQHRIDAECELPKTEFGYHEFDKRIIWIEQNLNDFPEDIEEQFEEMLKGLDRDMYAIIPLPPVLGDQRA